MCVYARVQTLFEDDESWEVQGDYEALRPRADSGKPDPAPAAPTVRVHSYKADSGENRRSLGVDTQVGACV